MGKYEEVGYDVFASDILMKLGSTEPSLAQINEMKAIVTNAWMRRNILLDKRLRKLERLYLYYRSYKKSDNEIANLLNINKCDFKNIQQIINIKLNSKNLKQAIEMAMKCRYLNDKN